MRISDWSSDVCSSDLIKADVVHLAGGDHDRSRLAHLGKGVDVVERIAGFAQIDEQDVRARRNRQRLDRIAQAALVDLLRRPAVFDDDRPEHFRRLLAADEGGERFAQDRKSTRLTSSHKGASRLPSSAY